jgi:hypothetical protein
MYVRKSLRSANAGSNERFARAFRIASRQISGPTFIEETDGQKVRQWGDGMEEWVTNDDVRAWLLGLRVVELRDGLEFVRETYIHNVLVREGYLRKDRTGSFYWITAKAAARFDLPKVLGCDFPN